jgi:serine/threonine protein kinase
VCIRVEATGDPGLGGPRLRVLDRASYTRERQWVPQRTETRSLRRASKPRARGFMAPSGHASAHRRLGSTCYPRPALMDSLDVVTRPFGTQADAEQEDALVGRVLDGRYRLLRRLGRGGMGAVYEAEHAKLESKVAIKVLQASLSTNEKYRKRFLREARAASAIESAHIVRSSDFGATDDGLLYFAMELMEGQDLEQHLQGCSRIEWALFDPILFQVTSALRAAHKRGVIHRDVKPSNCFLCATEAWPPLVKVLDFGIAKINAAAADGESPVATLETLTATNELFGTIAYMAPEIIEGQPADARSDIYALGVMMFRALTGQLPFTSPNVYKLLQQHVSTPVPSLRALVPEIPAAVESVVFRAMAKHAGHRYQTIDELEGALEAAREGVIEPSAAALSGHTQAVQRGASSGDPSPSGDVASSTDPRLAATLPSAHGVTHRVEDPGSLVSARIRAPRFSPLAVFGLALVVAGGTAAAVFSLVEPSSPAPVEPSVVVAQAAGASEAVASPNPLPGSAVVAPVAQAPATSAVTPTKDEAAEAPDIPAPEPAVAGPKASSRKSSGASRPGGTTKPRSLDELAGAACPDAIGGRFTIEGLLSGQGKYINPQVDGSPKSARGCIETFIRTRSFGKGRSMEPHTEQLSPR